MAQPSNVGTRNASHYLHMTTSTVQPRANTKQGHSPPVLEHTSRSASAPPRFSLLQGLYSNSPCSVMPCMAKSNGRATQYWERGSFYGYSGCAVVNAWLGDNCAWSCPNCAAPGFLLARLFPGARNLDGEQRCTVLGRLKQRRSKLLSETGDSCLQFMSFAV